MITDAFLPFQGRKNKNVLIVPDIRMLLNKNTICHKKKTQYYMHYYMQLTFSKNYSALNVYISGQPGGFNGNFLIPMGHIYNDSIHKTKNNKTFTFLINYLLKINWRSENVQGLSTKLSILDTY